MRNETQHFFECHERSSLGFALLNPTYITMYYSNNPEEGCLYLYDAWINDEGKYIDLKIHGLFLAERIHQCFFVGCASPLDKLRTGFTQPTLINSSESSRRIETKYPSIIKPELRQQTSIETRQFICFMD